MFPRAQLHFLSDGLAASPMEPDSYKGWISCKRIFIRKKNPFYSSVLFVKLVIYCLGEIRAEVWHLGYWQCQGEW